MTRRPLPAASLLLLILCVPLGCGYALRGTLPAHLRTVGVPIFANRTASPTVDSLITRAVVQAFSTNGKLKVVNPADADAILEGEVTGFTVVPIAFDPQRNVREFRLIVTLNLRFRDLKRNAILFEQSGFQERSDFQVPSASASTNVVSQTVAEEETALRSAAVDIARAVVSFAVERF